MKPIFLKVFNSQKTSIDIRHEKVPYFQNPWHFHPELELTLIIESSGTHFIGNHINAFHKNELTLTGPNLPHYWRCDSIYYQGLNLKAEAIIIRFPKQFLGNRFFLLPEMSHINHLFEISRKGMKILGETRDQAAEAIKSMVEMDGAERIIALLQILNLLANSSEYKIMSSIGFAQTYGTSDIDRINNVYSYLMENFMFPIKLEAVASVANMNPAAFCRFFKAKTGKTLIQFLHEIKIGHACKLLIEGKLNVSEVCYACGFQNESYFIKQFKKITHRTPLQYQNQHNKKFLVY